MTNANGAPKSIAIVTSKFPSAQFIAQGMSRVAKTRGIEEKLYLEYEMGTRDFAPLAARIRAADADLLWVGALGLDGNALLEALAKFNYKPRNHFYLYPSSGPLTSAPNAEGAVAPTLFEDVAPFNQNELGKFFTAEFSKRAKAAGLSYVAADGHAGEAFAMWQVLTAAAQATNSLDDKKIADWLRTNSVDTIIGKIYFSGQNNYGPDLQRLKQIQGGQWVIVWPKDVASARLSASAITSN